MGERMGVDLDKKATSGWTHGICGCFNNIGICLISFAAPCYVSGKNSEALDGPCLKPALWCLVPGLGCVTRTIQRTELRVALRQEGTLTNDCLMVTFLPCCSLAQEAESLKHALGEDMARQ